MFSPGRGQLPCSPMFYQPDVPLKESSAKRSFVADRLGVEAVINLISHPLAHGHRIELTVDSDGRARRTRVWRREGAPSPAFSGIHR
jgi:hypothetical protein